MHVSTGEGQAFVVVSLTETLVFSEIPPFYAAPMDARVDSVHDVLETKPLAWESTIMNGENKERWMRLCELASKEQDPDKLMQLVQEITRLLEERELSLKSRRSGSDGELISN
jgi:hypothetical protein